MEIRDVAPAVDARTAALFAPADLAGILTFVLAGEAQHRIGGVGPAYVFDTAAPFVVGWVLAGVALGAYAAGARDSVAAMAAATVPAWVVGAVVGVAVRGTELFHGTAAPTLALVAALVGAVTVSGFRALVLVAVRLMGRVG